MKAAHIRWKQDKDSGDDDSTNDKTKTDSIIFATKGTADTSGDVEIMVREDFTETLTMEMFDVL